MALTGKGGVGGRRRPEQVTQVVLKQLVGRALGAPSQPPLNLQTLQGDRPHDRRAGWDPETGWRAGLALVSPSW